MWPHRWQPTRLHHPWDSPGKKTGVGCHFLLQCMKVKSESEVSRSCPTFSYPMDCSLPGSSVHGIFQARVLEWVTIAFSKAGLLDKFNPLKWQSELPMSMFATVTETVPSMFVTNNFNISCKVCQRQLVIHQTNLTSYELTGRQSCSFSFVWAQKVPKMKLC